MRRQAPPYPPVARRGLFACFLLPQVVIVTSMVVLHRCGLLHPGSPLGSAVFMLPPAGAVAGGLMLRSRLRRLRRRVATAAGCVCVRCGYAVQGLGESGICPECGLAFDRSRTVQAWIHAKLFQPPV